MALTPVPPLSALLQMLSSDTVAAQGRRPAQVAEGVPSTRQAAPRDGRKTPAERLRARLRLACTQADWSASKALRLLVEVALLRDMGESLQLDPDFGDLVERTSRAIEQDESCAQLISDSFEQMTALGREPPGG